MYNKISIIGGSGSGKSTLCNILANELNLPEVHLDAINYDSNWTQVDKKKRDDIINKRILEDKWVIDGNYSSTMRERLLNADLVIFLDYSTFALLCGVLNRVLKNSGKERFEIPGCKEHFDFEFLKLVSCFRRKKRPKILKILSEINQDKIITFKNRKELNKWLIDFTKNENVLKKYITQ